MVRNIGLRGFLSCIVIGLSVAWAQGLPLIKLSDLSLEAGETLTVTASDLMPGALYTLILSSESGDGTLQKVAADAQGDLTFAAQLGTPGRWRLNVQGDNLDAQFDLLVTNTATQNPPDTALPETPESTAPDAAPDNTPPDNTTPNATAPDATAPAPLPSDEAAPERGTSPSASQPPAATPETSPATPNTSPFTPAQVPPETPSLETTPLETTPLETTPLETTPLETTPPETTPSEATPRVTSPPSDESTPAVTPDEVVLENGAVVARANGRVLWSLDFPADSGETAGLLVQPEAVYVGHGNSLLTLDPLSGVVQNRLALPSQVTDLTRTPDGLTVTTGAEALTLRGGVLATPVQFAPVPALFGWLRNAAAVADPAARLAQDPTNPWLYLRAGQAADNAPERAREFFAAAVEHAATFYDAAGLSRALLELGEPDLANRAFDKALQDFAARGYDPRLLRDLDLHEAYNFPLRPMQDALADADLERAGFWAPWLAYFATPDVPAAGRALRDYADLLRRNGQTDEAARWRDLAQGRLRTPGTLASTARFLGRSAWYGALALLATFLALHLTLAAKYWRAQSVNFERRRLLKRSVSPVSRTFIMRFYSLTEKLVLLALLAGTLLLAGLASGYREAGNGASLGLGTFEDASVQAYVRDAALGGTRGQFVQGYAAQVAGDAVNARDRYAASGDFAPALNNLGTLSGDETFYRRAAELAKLPEARYNLGEPLDTGEFAFQRDYRPGVPLLAVPSLQDVQVALAGDWSGSVTDMFTNPWAVLRAARPAGLDAALWTPLVVLFLALVALTLVWLFIPRLRWVRNAPRTWAYHLLALLVPGSGLADEMWGLLLLVPWALVGFDTLAHLYAWDIGFGWSLQTDFIVLGAVYFVNTVAATVEFWSYRRRMAALKRENPELALEFGLIRPTRVRRLG